MSRLQAALNDIDKAPEQPAKVKPAAKKRVSTTSRKSSREKTVLIGGHFDPEVQKQLRMIAAEEGTTNQALLTEALNLLFRKKGKAAIL